MNPEDIPDFVRNSVSWNPWHGCHRVSDGCLNCYMFVGDKSRGVNDSDIVRRSKTQFDLPLRKDRKGKYLLRDRLILTSMTSDFFIEEADAWRDEAWSIIRKRKDCTFIILTKRPHRIPDCLTAVNCIVSCILRSFQRIIDLAKLNCMVVIVQDKHIVSFRCGLLFRFNVRSQIFRLPGKFEHTLYKPFTLLAVIEIVMQRT